MLISVARAHMEEKYQWAEESLAIIRDESSDFGPHKEDEPGIIYGTDSQKLKYALWAYLTAYQQIRFYHGKWQKENGLVNLSNKYVDKWKADFLTLEQTIVWDLLNKFRTLDTHNEPVLPEISIRKRVLRIQDNKILMVNGKALAIGRRKTLEVNIEGRYYELLFLVTTGLICLRIFVDTVDQVSLP